LRLAVYNSRSAVAITPAGHPYRARHLHNLSVALQALYAQNGKQRSLAEAVTCARAAVAAVPADHPDLAACQFQLGSLLAELASRSGRVELAEEAYRLDCAVAANPAAQTMTRITASRQAASYAAAHGLNERALELYEAGIDLAQRLAPRSLARPDREHLLEQLAGVAAEAAAAAVSAGQPGRAVELLERSRGLLVADMLEARVSDLTRLKYDQPELARSLQALVESFADLDRRQASARQPLITDFAHDQEAGLPQGDSSLAADRQTTQRAWDELIGRIRTTDGFAGFLRAPQIADLAAQAADGPIVFVYAAQNRCDALIVRQAAEPAVKVVPMSGMTRDDVLAQVERMMKMRVAIAAGDPAGRRQADFDLQEILAWTWDAIAAPVMDALGYSSTPAAEDDWPRIWWCPVGSVAYLPLHAAGHHLASERDDHPRAVVDLVVSSYTPTLRGLAYARAHQPADPMPGARPRKALIVAAPGIAGAGALPGARRETAAVSALLPGADILAEPTKVRILRALPEYPIAHFACHAVADLTDPAASHLVLADQESAPLTVAEIGALALNAGLAYLSACETTAATLDLADEAVHITGAFHLAGYQHVIGTAWPVFDTTASRMAKSFYTRLANNSAASADVQASALALHHSVRRARANWTRYPTKWAPYTHTGP
jgi:DNA-binding transcriptional ArsR family regulator